MQKQADRQEDTGRQTKEQTYRQWDMHIPCSKSVAYICFCLEFVLKIVLRFLFWIWVPDCWSSISWNLIMC